MRALNEKVSEAYRFIRRGLIFVGALVFMEMAAFQRSVKQGEAETGDCYRLAFAVMDYPLSRKLTSFSTSLVGGQGVYQLSNIKILQCLLPALCR